MKNHYRNIFILSVCLIVFSCDGGPKLNGKPAVTLTPNIADGKIYYETNCGGCHAAGNDDLSSAFGDKTKMDLKASQKIVSNMSQQGGPNKLMARFTNIREQRVLDLIAYLKNVK